MNGYGVNVHETKSQYIKKVKHNNGAFISNMYDRVVFFWTRSVCFKSQVKPEIYDFTCTDQMTCSPRLIPLSVGQRSIVMFYFIYFNSNLSGYIWCMIKVSWSLNNSYCSSSCGYSRSFFYSINIEHSPSQRSQNQHKYTINTFSTFEHRHLILMFIDTEDAGVQKRLEVSYHTCCVFQFAVFTRS
jgi:hypothetical protein